jgi:hypothetical protein
MELARDPNVVYASASRSLAMLEILVHYSELPSDFVTTAISIPDRVMIAEVTLSDPEISILPRG